MDPAQAVTITALDEIERCDLPADRVLKHTLRSHTWLDDAGRRAVARGVHGVRCFLLRLDYLLEHAGLPRDNRHRLALYRFDIDGEPPTHGVERARGVAWPDDPVEEIAVRRSIPRWVAAAWIDAYGLAEADALGEASNRPGPIAARVNRRMNDVPALIARLAAEGVVASPGRIAPFSLRLEGRPDIRGSPAWREGRFEVQDEGSQLVALALGARPNETVVDLCAGAGGKTLAIADDMEDEGLLVACDPSPERLHDLQVRLGRVETTCVRPVRIPADDDPGDLLPAAADRILVDAPCSALGTLRRGPDRRWRIGEEAPRRLAEIQSTLLARAADRLAPGGRLVYATCTLLPAENEEVIQNLLAKRSDLAPAPVLPDILQDDPPGVLQLMPHRHDTDGFFLAAFERT